VVDTKLAVPLAAAGKQGPVRITASGLAAGAVLTSAPGASANAELAWTPRRSQLGTHVFVFLGTSVDGAAVTRPRAIFVHVIPATPPAAREEKPIGTNGVYRWAYVARPAAVRARPSTASRVVTHLSTFTRDETVNLVLLLARTQDARGRTWYRVRLPILPNNSTGWILTGALTTTRSVSTYLVIYRKLFTATLYRNGVPVFQTRVGIGKPYWPTPAGDFYIREILTGFTDPMYGPVAFGTSARSAVLTDWHGGGGVVGIHGTNRPEILPGRVSHGCVRMRNAAIRRLHRLMPLGTPVAIR
jgi:lipoprotein-anchoring transpeptidase ErfK/SrfK